MDRLVKSRAVMGSRERPDQPGYYAFDWLQSPEQFVLDYVTTTIPPKKAFFPPTETLFTFSLSDPPEFNTVREQTPFILAGVHPCDLAAIDCLDQAYSHPPADARWKVNRERAIIIGVDCMPDEYCFCTAMDSCTARKPSDLFLTKIDRGYMVEIHSSAGERLLAEVHRTEPQKQDFADTRRWHEEKMNRALAKFNVGIARFADILEAGGLADIWHQVAERCYSCGSCNTTCPTCFCFDIKDDFNLNLTGGIRRRTWDSCQLLEFALVAGGHNFRRDRWQRVRHRWHRKFLYLYRQFRRPYCTGCGRCSRACTADINIVDISNQIIAYSQQGASDA
jgi:sulfhydrogenase subunit beta (sulfur reductase)